MADLSRLEELLAKATKGPWEATERSGYHEVLAPDDDCDWYGRPKRHAIFYGDTELPDEENTANATLIAEAIDALPSLIARIRQLEAERDEAVDWSDIVDLNGTDQFDDLAERWLALESIRRTHQAMASPFAPYASEDIMQRFMKMMRDQLQLAYVEGAGGCGDETVSRRRGPGSASCAICCPVHRPHAACRNWLQSGGRFPPPNPRGSRKRDSQC